MFDTEITAAQPAPRLWLVTRFPSSSFIRVEDESSDWIMVRVGTAGKCVSAHFDGEAMLDDVVLRFEKRLV